jgi:hypothetical protein
MINGKKEKGVNLIYEWQATNLGTNSKVGLISYQVVFFQESFKVQIREGQGSML